MIVRCIPKGFISLIQQQVFNANYEINTNKFFIVLTHRVTHHLPVYSCKYCCGTFEKQVAITVCHVTEKPQKPPS